MKICPTCKEENGNNNHVCFKCSTPLPVVTQTTNYADYKEEEPPVFLLVVAALMWIIGVIAGIVYCLCGEGYKAKRVFKYSLFGFGLYIMVILIKACSSGLL